MTKEKNRKGKEKKVKKERQPHPIGPPEARAKDYDHPSPNPTFFTYANKSVANLPKNLREVFEAVGKHADGVALKGPKGRKDGAQVPALAGAPAREARVPSGGRGETGAQETRGEKGGKMKDSTP